MSKFKERERKEVNETTIAEFTNKIGEVLERFLPNMPFINEKGIKQIKKLIYLYIDTYFVKLHNGMHCSLSSLISFAAHDANISLNGFFPYDKLMMSRYKEAVKDVIESDSFKTVCENFDSLPFLDMLMKDDFLGVCDYKGNVIYCTDEKEYPVKKDYELISEAEYNSSEKKRL